MKTLIFDIETVGYPFESFDDFQREYLMRFAEMEESEEKRRIKKDEVIRYLNLSALTAQIVTIGMFDVERGKGLILFQSENREEFKSEDEHFTFRSDDEKVIIETFWKTIEKYDQFVTFNGRGFDAPFLHLRSAILRIKPTKNLIPYRYDSKIHCDLLEQFTFYGLVRKYNLDFYCKAFGIGSPKRGEVTGHNINEMFAEKKFKEIAEYCSKDLIATYELFKVFKEFLEIPK
ncbi:MAG: ribonuclease H-like domain-containing protein [Bacteroidetes bacterium]|nr:ribonuclease H-like domain-containing protein [Bacteroidota bacterium]MBU2585974.1 ribonuclease H-like domain-containing protein [Bacteroidota bacterium]